MSRGSESPRSPELRRSNSTASKSVSAGNKLYDPSRTISVVLDVVRDDEREFCSEDWKMSTSVFNLEFEDPCGHAHLMNSLGISIWEGDLQDGEPSLTGNDAMVSRQAVDIFAGNMRAN